MDFRRKNNEIVTRDKGKEVLQFCSSAVYNSEEGSPYSLLISDI